MSTRAYFAGRYAAQEARRSGGAAGDLVELQAPKPSKYHNVKTDGYDSKKEAKRAAELRLLERAGQIRNLREQMPYLLIPTETDEHGKVIERACMYVADFTFEELVHGNWCTVVLDVKGVRTDVYRIKRKLMQFVHGITIREE